MNQAQGARVEFIGRFRIRSVSDHAESAFGVAHLSYLQGAWAASGTGGPPVAPNQKLTGGPPVPPALQETEMRAFGVPTRIEAWHCFGFFLT